MPTADVDFLLGHGTENDFVVLPDDDAQIELSPDLIRRLCDRRAGLGGDGILRIARGDALVRAGVLDRLPDGVAGDEWFMDYRNADGSIAEMCGNGVRTFAHALVATGRATAGEIPIGTRAGLRPATVLEWDDRSARVQVDMGEPRIFGESTVSFDGAEFSGIAIDVGNPHLAAVVDGLDSAALARLPIESAPDFDAGLFPNGVNVEVATPLAGGLSHMRVHERGSGETRSCGTGIVATAVALLRARGRDEGDVRIRVPGGEVSVELAGGRATMRGPSRLVARGTALL